MSLSHHVFTRGQKDLYGSHIKRSKKEEGEKKQGGNVFFFQGGEDSRCPITFDICRKIVKNHNIDRGQQLRKGKLKKQNNVKNRYFFYVKSKFGKKEKIKYFLCTYHFQSHSVLHNEKDLVVVVSLRLMKSFYLYLLLMPTVHPRRLYRQHQSLCHWGHKPQKSMVRSHVDVVDGGGWPVFVRWRLLQPRRLDKIDVQSGVDDSCHHICGLQFDEKKIIREIKNRKIEFTFWEKKTVKFPWKQSIRTKI